MKVEPESALPPNPADEVTYALSHELRGPLLNFQGFLRRLSTAYADLDAMAQQWSLTDDQRRGWQELLGSKIQPSLDVLTRAAGRMDGLLNALLELSRAGREPLCYERVSTAELVQQLAEELRPVATEKSATLAMDPMPDLWADAGRLRLVFRHLLANALQFLSPARPGQIRLGGRSGPAEDVCWVEDNGIGIRAEDQARLFLPFGRVRELEAPGEGIGLATVRKLVEQQGGRVWVESIHGQGSTFFVALPARPPDKAASAAGPAYQDSPKGSTGGRRLKTGGNMTATTGPKSVLVVEDDRDYCHLLHDAFAEAGFRILEADNGQAALQLLRREPVDLVVSDFIMPELNGLELCRLLRNDLDLSSTKVVVYSCNTDASFRRKARELGALDYLPKTDAPQMVQRICEVAGFSGSGKVLDSPIQPGAGAPAGAEPELNSDVVQLQALLDNVLDFARIASLGEPSSTSARVAWEAIHRTAGDVKHLLDAIEAGVTPGVTPANGRPIN